MPESREQMLEVAHLSSGYGRVSVLRDVSIDVREGEVVTIIGANGAGKSTLLSCIAGVLPPWSGSIRLSGDEIGGMPAEKIVSKGFSLVPEGRRLFSDLSVRENLELGTYAIKRDRSAKLAEGLDLVHELFPVLLERSEQAAATLSGGEQQMLAVARGLMSQPRLLVLDEPSLGLAPKIIGEIFSVLDALRERGLTILLVEQDARLALKHADRGYVLRTGEVVLAGSSDELLANDDVRLIYLGAWHGDSTAAGSEGAAMTAEQSESSASADEA